MVGWRAHPSPSSSARWRPRGDGGVRDEAVARDVAQAFSTPHFESSTPRTSSVQRSRAPSKTSWLSPVACALGVKFNLPAGLLDDASDPLSQIACARSRSPSTRQRKEAAGSAWAQTQRPCSHAGMGGRTGRLHGARRPQRTLLSLSGLGDLILTWRREPQRQVWRHLGMASMTRPSAAAPSRDNPTLSMCSRTRHLPRERRVPPSGAAGLARRLD